MLRQVFLSLLFFLTLSNANARLLDKMVAVFNDKVITLSQLKRVNQNLAARRNISPGVYTKIKYNDAEISKIIIRRYMTREKLAELGYIINDDQVESQIKSTEKRLRLNRKALLQFLKSNNMTFDEYFEIIRETIEYNIFYSRVIRPLISITEQEIKNYYYRNNLKNKTVAFRYNLIDFSMDASAMTSKMKKSFKNMLRKFQTNGVLPNKYSELQTNELGNITEEGLTADLKNVLKRTDQGSFSNPIKLGNAYHVFFIKKKDLVASSNYKKARLKIREQLFQNTASKVTSLWFKRENNKHYIKYFF
ncbi:MAG: peptidyl-prolyl cis-trans isomerase [Bacteriovoracaceae bacterium]|jgi:peptidyl-prolyl cis-trans isomerase SurA|nr:peptidyl-prolyl cis-trans isomerase [Bacteriovoracaceae bacterium]